MFFHAMRAAGLVAMSTLVAFAGDRQVSLQGVETGHYISHFTSAFTLTSVDFAEGIAPRVGKYTLLAREEINLQTRDIRDGEFVITAANGGTIRGTYSGAASLGDGSISWVADGSIAGGTGRYAGATGTIHFEGFSNTSTCQPLEQDFVCGFTEATAIELVLP